MSGNRNKRRRGRRRPARGNYLDHKIGLTLADTNLKTINASQLGILNRTSQIIYLAWTVTSIDPNTFQVQMYNSAGEACGNNRMALIHKNVTRGRLRAPRGLDPGVYTGASPVFSVISSTAGTSTVVVAQFTVRLRYPEPFGFNSVLFETPPAGRSTSDAEESNSVKSPCVWTPGTSYAQPTNIPALCVKLSEL